MASEERLISADAFIEDIKTEAVNLLLDGFKGTPQPTDHLFAIIDRINEQPTVDAVEVVRCKDCKHYDNSEGIQWCHLNSKFAQWGTDWHSFPEDGFCSYGERKEKAKDQQDCTYNKNGHCIGQKLMPECDAKHCDRRK